MDDGSLRSEKHSWGGVHVLCRGFQGNFKGAPGEEDWEAGAAGVRFQSSYGQLKHELTKRAAGDGI